VKRSDSGGSKRDKENTQRRIEEKKGVIRARRR